MWPLVSILTTWCPAQFSTWLGTLAPHCLFPCPHPCPVSLIPQATRNSAQVSRGFGWLLTVFLCVRFFFFFFLVTHTSGLPSKPRCDTFMRQCPKEPSVTPLFYRPGLCVDGVSHKWAEDTNIQRDFKWWLDRHCIQNQGKWLVIT